MVGGTRAFVTDQSDLCVMQSPTQESSHSLTYSPIHSFNHPHPAELSSWQGYSADRTQIHP